ncbi:uncharacterized protein LOC116965900 [Tyto alba]|uniref:uncharacterized protein LOC116965900 n=1 Tax=Tyto alba TaxID=56313 RepID=UPI001C674140|nr:uncharacterized protein LOC116965900 [Tyto alba]XP_042648293.1 uncharacterized protein LOC116965900 [Tyto alba]XP_042648294.1 uncharacterized protein LOC116965900 [Tyto alba]XP_042648295.1 uncharacterized protein LOC116965900 [Tyto alba]XP_042648296.1 uncharacterized protein LOC116965900 [Tyto alba]
MSWLTRGGKSREKEDPESSPNREERGLLVQAMLEHGGDPWDSAVVGQDPTLKAAERHWQNYVSVYHPKGEKKCSALQWLLFGLARVLQAAVEQKEERIQNLQNDLQGARNEILALRCDSSLLSEQAEELRKLREELRAAAVENAQLRSKVQCLGTLLSLGKGLDRSVVAALNLDPAGWDRDSWSSGAQKESPAQGAGTAGDKKAKLAEGDGGQGEGDMSRKEKAWRKRKEGWPLWVNRMWTLEQCTPFTHEAAKQVVTAIGLPWPKVGAVIRALPAGEVSGGEILRLVIRNLGEYEPLKDNMEGAPWRDVQEASAYVCGNVLLRVLKQRETLVTPDFDIFGVKVEQGDVGVLACRAPELHKGFFISLGSTLIGRPLGECMATLENMGTLIGAEGKGMAKRDGLGAKRRKYIPRGTIWRYLISQGVNEGELDSQPTGVLLAKMKKIIQEKGMKQEEMWEKLKQMNLSAPPPISLGHLKD